MNQEFPTDIRLEGIALGKPDRGNEGDLSPYIVTSQRAKQLFFCKLIFHHIGMAG
jgi:hypothetical protein